MAKLNELSRQAEQTTEAMHSAQLDLGKKLVAKKAAEAEHAKDDAAAELAKAQLAKFQAAVDKVAAAQYMGGRTNAPNAILTADSPQALIDQLATQQVMATEMSAQMKSYLTISEQTARAEKASAKSSAEAKTAAEQAAAVRADLQSKQSQLQLQIAVVKSQYLALSPGQRDALAVAPPPPAAALPAPAPDGALPAPAPDGAAPGGPSAVAVQAAMSRIGSRYTWGGAGPNAFDCSGLVMWAFNKAGVSLPHSSQAMARGGQPVSMDQMQPGDVVTYYSDASHVGLYIGDGKMVDASTYGIPVRVAPVNNAPIYNIRRY